ncbi:MAG TPA: caspase family protein, partial [Nitrospirae bacterium]|nr:caspase family protein [Nitrospirota bacterium]
VIGGRTTQLNEGVSILTASKADEASVEVNGHGVFTNLLLDALQGGAADLRGHISPGGVNAYIDQALGPWGQRPVFKTNVTRFTSLRTITPQVPLAILRKITEYFPAPQEEFSLDPSYEDTNTKTVKHNIIEPYATSENVAVFKNLQKLQSVGLVIPVDAEYMYFAAMESKACKLTSLGYHYWRLVKERRI